MEKKIIMVKMKLVFNMKSCIIVIEDQKVLLNVKKNLVVHHCSREMEYYKKATLNR